MPVDDKDRQRKPLEDAWTEEPTQEIPRYLQQRPDGRARQRETPVRPSERRRRDRQLSVTFSSADIPDRLRELAYEWEMYAPDKKSPAVSAVLEHLLMPRLEEAENGKVNPPKTR